MELHIIEVLTNILEYYRKGRRMFSNGFVPINLPKKREAISIRGKIKAMRRKIRARSLGI